MYGKEEISGIITEYSSLPRSYKIGRTTINLQTASAEIIASQGFKPLVKPFITRYQRYLQEWDLIDGVYHQKYEDFTAEEIAEKDANDLANQQRKEVEQQLTKAQELAKDIFVFVRKHTGLTDNQKGILMGLAKDLMQGDIEQAKDDFGNITRPVNENKMQKVYDTLKTKFDAL